MKKNGNEATRYNLFFIKKIFLRPVPCEANFSLVSLGYFSNVRADNLQSFNGLSSFVRMTIYISVVHFYIWKSVLSGGISIKFWLIALDTHFWWPNIANLLEEAVFSIGKVILQLIIFIFPEPSRSIPERTGFWIFRHHLGKWKWKLLWIHLWS